MKALLDTNIIIHRESNNNVNVIKREIGSLFKWLNKAGYEYYIHPITTEELNKNRNSDVSKILNIKIQSYEILKTQAKLSERSI